MGFRGNPKHPHYQGSFVSKRPKNDRFPDTRLISLRPAPHRDKNSVWKTKYNEIKCCRLFEQGEGWFIGFLLQYIYPSGRLELNMKAQVGVVSSKPRKFRIICNALETMRLLKTTLKRRSER